MPVVSEADYPKEAQLRIEELEQQVKEFSVRAVMAGKLCRIFIALFCL